MDLVSILPHVNATLNGLATVLLVVGYVLIRRGQVTAHKWTMLGCFGLSVVFLASYLTYHAQLEGHGKPFPDYPPNWVRWSYYGMLLTHVVLAAVVPFLAVATIYLGLTGRFETHRKVARWTFPIWLYVSLTGVLVYLCLYQWFPAQTPSTGL